MILRNLDLDAAGLYQAAWVLGGLYVGFILQAMGTDFYPRLTSVSRDNVECNRLVNEQAHISILLAGPGILGTLTFAPVVISLFYSEKFHGAVEPLRWICVGMALRVIAWPMGFIVLAKGVQSVFFWTELIATIVHVGMAFLLIKFFGLSGACMAFFTLYVWHGLLIYFVVRRLSGFRWSKDNCLAGLFFLVSIAVVFLGFYLLPFWAAIGLGSCCVLISGVYSIRILLQLVSSAKIPKNIRRCFVWLRLAPATIL
jgi:PST family polysaccharide transporter